MRLLVAFILLIQLFGTQALAQNRALVVPGSETLHLQSEETGQGHELIVILPTSYAASPTRRYPTLYFLDAYWDFALVYSIYEQMRLDNLLPELILVGLSYPGGNDAFIRRRVSDFTPVVDKKLPGSGAAPAFLRFVKETVVPRIEARFRADPAHRALAGHSLGGLFTLYALYQEPQFFERYLALSPSAITGPGYLQMADSAYAKKRQGLHARLMIAYGEEEYAPYRQAMAEYETQLSERRYSGLVYRHEILPNMRHTSAKTHGYLMGLPWLFEDLAPREPSTFSQFLKDHLGI